VLDATRAHIELYRAALERRGLAASTIDYGGGSQFFAMWVVGTD
jgi:hypothetical protein